MACSGPIVARGDGRRVVRCTFEWRGERTPHRSGGARDAWRSEDGSRGPRRPDVRRSASGRSRGSRPCPRRAPTTVPDRIVTAPGEPPARASARDPDRWRPPRLHGLRPGADARVRAPEPAAERVPAFLRDRLARRPPDPCPAPAEGHRPPGQRRLPLPAARRRAPRAELRQRCMPLAALQPVRVLRGGAERRVESRPRVRPSDAAGRSAYQAAVRALTERGRFGIRLGLARTRALLQALGDPQLALGVRWSVARTARAASWRSPAARCAPRGSEPGRRRSRTSSAIASGWRSTAGRSTR